MSITNLHTLRQWVSDNNPRGKEDFQEKKAERDDADELKLASVILTAVEQTKLFL